MAIKAKDVFAMARAADAVKGSSAAVEALEKVLEAYAEAQAAKAAHKEAGKKTAADSKDKRDSLLVEMKSYSLRCWADNVAPAAASAALRYRLTENGAPEGTVKNYGTLVAGAVTGLNNGTITPEALEGFSQKQWQDATASAETRAAKAALEAIAEAWKDHAEGFKSPATLMEAAMLLVECIKTGAYMDAAIVEAVTEAEAEGEEEKQAA